MYRRVSQARKPKNSVDLSKAIISDDPELINRQDYEDPDIFVTRPRVQARVGEKKFGTKKSGKSVARKRYFAEALHRQADLLHNRGDYESALYLYHRAASFYPREPRHVEATRKTAAAITSAINPWSASKKVSLPGAKNLEQAVAANFCLETAASEAKKILEESSDPVSTIKQILDYFDSRKDYWRERSVFQYPRSGIASGVKKSKPMLKQSKALESNTLKDLQAAFASGNLNESLKIGVKLLAISKALPSRYRYHYQVAAHHYLAMIQIALGRHDRAVDQVSRMVRLAKASGDSILRSRSMMTLGKVHLSFGHLEAAARAWERLVPEIEEAIPKAWILHEIGRCYFEMKVYPKALETAARCIEYGQEGNSRKWLMHGKLLSGQTLVELGRYGEAIAALTLAATLAQEDNNHQTSQYLSSLINRLSIALRIALYPNQFNLPLNPTTSSSSSGPSITSNLATFNDDHPQQNSIEQTPKSRPMSDDKNQDLLLSIVKMKKRTSGWFSIEPSPTEKSQPRNIVNRSCPSSPKAIFHLGTTMKDVSPSESESDRRMVDDLSSLDETVDDNRLPTYRIPIIPDEIHENSTENFEYSDDQRSFSTGKTYVLDRAHKSELGILKN